MTPRECLAYVQGVVVGQGDALEKGVSAAILKAIRDTLDRADAVPPVVAPPPSPTRVVVGPPYCPGTPYYPAQNDGKYPSPQKICCAAASPK